MVPRGPHRCDSHRPHRCSDVPPVLHRGQSSGHAGRAQRWSFSSAGIVPKLLFYVTYFSKKEPTITMFRTGVRSALRRRQGHIVTSLGNK